MWPLADLISSRACRLVGSETATNVFVPRLNSGSAGTLRSTLSLTSPATAGSISIAVISISGAPNSMLATSAIFRDERVLAAISAETNGMPSLIARCCASRACASLISLSATKRRARPPRKTGLAAGAVPMAIDRNAEGWKRERRMARNVGARRSRVNPGWPLTTVVNEKRVERAPPVQINVNARRRSIAFHRIEERGIGLGLAHAVDQELHRRHFVHVVQQFAQDPDLVEVDRIHPQLFLARAGAVDVDRREPALLGDASLPMEFHVAGSLAFLIDNPEIGSRSL